MTVLRVDREFVCGGGGGGGAGAGAVDVDLICYPLAVSATP